jgi:hypothetical protein
MKNIITVIVLLMTIHLSGYVNAGIITTSADKLNVNIGDTVEINLLASSFDSFDVFDLALVFDTSLFTYEPNSLVSDLPSSAPFGLFVNEVATGVALSYVDFLPYVGGDFLLANFTLTALKVGFTDFNLLTNEFSLSDPLDIFSTPIDLVVDISGNPGTNITAVPEPSTLLLFILTIMAFGVYRVRNSN